MDIFNSDRSPGGAAATSVKNGTNFGYKVDIFWTCSGHFLGILVDMFWTYWWTFFGHGVDIFGASSGHFWSMKWINGGHIWTVSAADGAATPSLEKKHELANTTNLHL